MKGILTGSRDKSLRYPDGCWVLHNTQLDDACHYRSRCLMRNTVVSFEWKKDDIKDDARAEIQTDAYAMLGSLPHHHEAYALSIVGSHDYFMVVLQWIELNKTEYKLQFEDSDRKRWNDEGMKWLLNVVHGALLYRRQLDVRPHQRRSLSLLTVSCLSMSDSNCCRSKRARHPCAIRASCSKKPRTPMRCSVV
jgi:hypothetical protein